MLKKPTKFGIKVWILAKAKPGYVDMFSAYKCILVLVLTKL